MKKHKTRVVEKQDGLVIVFDTQEAYILNKDGWKTYLNNEQLEEILSFLEVN